jgi:antitoxin VapB
MVDTMAAKKDIAKVFRTGRSQAVRIPKRYRFDCDEVFIERKGEKVILTPRKQPLTWKEFFATSRGFSEDFEVPEDLPPKPIVPWR